MIKIAICDDQPDELAELAAIIKNYCKSRQKTISLDCFQSSHALLDTVEGQNHFDILILDNRNWGQCEDSRRKICKETRATVGIGAFCWI